MYNNNGFRPQGRGKLNKQLIQMGRHLVYSEGTRTEPYYVNNIKKNIANKFRCNTNDILLITATGEKSYHTTDLVEFAFNDVKKRLKEGYTVDHVWIMFDKDDFNGFNEAYSMINDKNNSLNPNNDGFRFEQETGIAWHPCPSNQCFELWLCLYFNLLNSKLDRKSYIKHLEQSTPLKKIKFKYQKNLENIHDTLVTNGGSLTNAIKYAKILEAANSLDEPSTGMYIFAEYFEKYMV